MVRKYYPVVLKFDYDTEYSIDDGSNWTALAANTEVEIDGGTITSASGRVMIRATVDEATSINYDNLQFRKRIFDHVNIRNGKKLGNLNNIFQYSIMDKVRINNIQALTSFSNAFSYSTIKQVDICEAPSCTNMYSMFTQADIKELSEIKGRQDTACDYQYMFQHAHIGKSGRLWFAGSYDTPVLNKFREMFYDSEFELMPYFEIYALTYNAGYSSSMYYFHKAFSDLKTKYMLYAKVYTVGTYGSSHTDYHYSISFGNSIGQSDFIYNSSIRFSGLDIYQKHSTSLDSRYTSKNLFRNNQYATSFFSRFVKNQYAYHNSSSITENPKFDMSKITIPIDSSNYMIFEDPEWMPLFSELDVYEGNDSLSDGIFSTVNDRIVKISNGKKYIAKWADRHDTKLTFGDPVDHNLASDNVWYSRDGKYAVQDGSDIKFYDENDNALGSVSITPDFAQMNTDGSKFYVITGNRYDTSDTNDQDISQTLTVYNTADGSQVSSFNIVNETNSETTGVYCPDNDSKIQLLNTKYVEDTGVMIPDESKITTCDESGNIALQTVLSTVAFEVFPSFAEEAEFVCVDKTSSPINVVRCFGS
jgi:hypothetical protein